MTTVTKKTPDRKPVSAQPYREAGIEPTIAEMLSEPIVRAVMRRDAINDDTIARVIAEARAQRSERRVA